MKESERDSESTRKQKRMKETARKKANKAAADVKPMMAKKEKKASVSNVV